MHFSDYRARHLDSGGVGDKVEILSEAGGRCALRTAWPRNHTVIVRAQGEKSVEVRSEDIDGVRVSRG